MDAAMDQWSDRLKNAKMKELKMNDWTGQLIYLVAEFQSSFYLILVVEKASNPFGTNG